MMLGHIEDKRRKLLLLEKSLLNALCAAFDPFEICARSCSCAPADIREGLLGADPYVCNRASQKVPSWHLADSLSGLTARPLSGAKRTSLIGWPMSANDPRRTFPMVLDRP